MTEFRKVTDFIKSIRRCSRPYTDGYMNLNIDTGVNGSFTNTLLKIMSVVIKTTKLYSVFFRSTLCHFSLMICHFTSLFLNFYVSVNLITQGVYSSFRLFKGIFSYLSMRVKDVSKTVSRRQFSKVSPRLVTWCKTHRYVTFYTFRCLDRGTYYR